MNITSPPPPSASSAALSILKPDFPEESKTLVAGEDASQPPAPTNSTRSITSAFKQFFVGPKKQSGHPPQHTALLPPIPSSNPLPPWNANRRAPGFRPFRHENNSPASNPLPPPIDNHRAPGFTPFRHENNSPASNPLPPRNDNPRAPGFTLLRRENNSPASNPLPLPNDNPRAPDFTLLRRENNSPASNPLPPPNNNHGDPSDELVAPPPKHTAVPQFGDWDEANFLSPSLTPSMHLNNFPYYNVRPSDELAAPPLEHTAVRPPIPSNNPLPRVNDNAERNAANHRVSYNFDTPLQPTDVCPPLHPSDAFPYHDVDQQQTDVHPPVHSSKFPYPDVDPYDESNNGWSTNLPYSNDALVVTRFQQILNECVACLSEINWRHMLAVQKRVLTREFTVNQLHLMKAVTLPETTSIYNAFCHLDAQTGGVVLIDSNALLSGILTRKDIETKVIALDIDLVNTPVSKVMTKNPIFVSSDTLALEAVHKMAKGKVTRLPIIENGKVIALFCIELCLDHYMPYTETSDTNKVKDAAMKTISQWNLALVAHRELAEARRKVLDKYHRLN